MLREPVQFVAIECFSKEKTEFRLIMQQMKVIRLARLIVHNVYEMCAFTHLLVRARAHTHSGALTLKSIQEKI